MDFGIRVTLEFDFKALVLLVLTHIYLHIDP